MSTPLLPSDEEIRILATADLLREMLVRQQSLGTGNVSGAKAGRESLDESVRQLSLTATVNPHLPIAWPHWPPGLLPKVMAACQKATRRLLAWYINPIVAQQNAHNFHVLRALQDVQRANERLVARVAELEQLTRVLAARLELTEEDVPRRGARPGDP